MQNIAIDNFCKSFCRATLVLSTCNDQPTLIPLLDPEDDGLLNENVEGEVFDVDLPEGWVRARVASYDICENLFELDTHNLDVWEFIDSIKYWSQPGIDLNQHLKNKRARHVFLSGDFA